MLLESYKALYHWPMSNFANFSDYNFWQTLNWKNPLPFCWSFSYKIICLNTTSTNSHQSAMSVKFELSRIESSQDIKVLKDVAKEKWYQYQYLKNFSLRIYSRPSDSRGLKTNKLKCWVGNCIQRGKHCQKILHNLPVRPPSPLTPHLFVEVWLKIFFFHTSSYFLP